jgi:hypothetical protein
MYNKMEEEIHLACQNDEDRSILSVLHNGWDSIIETYEHPLLRYFTTKEATVLRSVCSEFKDAVEVTSWDDRSTVIKHSLFDWKNSFPMAISAKIDARRVIVDRNSCARFQKLTIVNPSSMNYRLLADILWRQMIACTHIRTNFELLVENE